MRGVRLLLTATLMTGLVPAAAAADHGIQLDQSVPRIGAPAAWQRGYTGAGVKVAVLDTGIDANHPDLAGKVVAARSFTDDPAVDDFVGQGTHVAGIIAGTGAASGGRYRGVAPGATLINAKVMDGPCTPPTARVIAAIDWARSQGARVIYVTASGPPTDGADPLARAVNSQSTGTGPTAGPVFVAPVGTARTAPNPSGSGRRPAPTPRSVWRACPRTARSTSCRAVVPGSETSR